MTNNSPKFTAFKILIKNKLYSSPDYNMLKNIVEANGFTVIEYKKNTNSEYVSELIKRLRVDSAVEQNDSFLYINKNLKFVFINSQISYEDKCSLMRHELGHICDGDFKKEDSEYSRVQKEEFANEFSCYLKEPGFLFKTYVFVIRKWKILLSVLALAICLLGFLFVSDYKVAKTEEVPASTDVSTDVNTVVNTDVNAENVSCYVTSKGKKYHKRSCFIVNKRTDLKDYKKSEAVNLGYKPCMICSSEDSE